MQLDTVSCLFCEKCRKLNFCKLRQYNAMKGGDGYYLFFSIWVSLTLPQYVFFHQKPILRKCGYDLVVGICQIHFPGLGALRAPLCNTRNTTQKVLLKKTIFEISTKSAQKRSKSIKSIRKRLYLHVDAVFG